MGNRGGAERRYQPEVGKRGPHRELILARRKKGEGGCLPVQGRPERNGEERAEDVGGILEKRGGGEGAVTITENGGRKIPGKTKQQMQESQIVDPKGRTKPEGQQRE